MKYEYKPKGICAYNIELDVDGDTITSVYLYGGCDGNHKGLTALLRTVCDQLYQYGFRHFMILNGHGGNSAAIQSVGLHLYHKGALLANLNWWLMAGQIDPAWAGGHGGGEETAGVMAVDPALVKQEYLDWGDLTPYFFRYAYKTQYSYMTDPEAPKSEAKILKKALVGLFVLSAVFEVQNSLPPTYEAPVRIANSLPPTMDTPIRIANSLPPTYEAPVRIANSLPPTFDAPVRIANSLPPTMDTPVRIANSLPPVFEYKARTYC